MRSRRLPVAALMLWGLGLACWLHPWLACAGRLGLAFSISLTGIMNYGPGFGSLGQLFSRIW